MAIRGRSLLKSWFRRGVYPTAEQFADWMDSFWHREEDRLPVSAVENLPGLLNEKYARTDGEELERRHDELAAGVERKNTENDVRFEDMKAEHEEMRTEIAAIRTDMGDVSSALGNIINTLSAL